MAGAKIQTRPCSYTFSGSLSIPHFIATAMGSALLRPASPLDPPWSLCVLLPDVRQSADFSFGRKQGTVSAGRNWNSCLRGPVSTHAMDHPIFGGEHSLICKTRHGEETYSFLLAKCTEQQSWKAHWDQLMPAPHFTAKETGPQS